MKRAWMTLTMTLALALVTMVGGLTPTDAEAKRLGGGRSQGMQRTLPAENGINRTPTTPPVQQPPTNASPPLAGGAAAAAPKRNWMGPIAGLAAGLGIAALMSHFGLGAGMGNFLMMALLAVAAFFVIRWLMQRFASPKPMSSYGGNVGGLGSPGLQMAGAGGETPRYNGNPTTQPDVAPLQRSSFAAVPTANGSTGAGPVSSALPAGFDSAGFERIAKMIFIRMQTANDSGDLNDLRNFTTPEMYASIRLDLQERGTTPQNTDVVKVDAEVLEVVQETERQVVSVRFHGLIREEREAPATDFDEVWHLVKPNGDDNRNWAIAGIQQR